MSRSIRDRLRAGLFHALRAVFRLLPLSTAMRDRWRNWFVDKLPHLVPYKRRGALVDDALGLGSALRADHPAIGHVPRREGPLPSPLPATLVAFYLPQFHPIPENDAWWGAGFTEWRNVTRSLPQFDGHHQPRLPADLGFYDLRSPAVMREQVRLAREYGVGAFCFYFYWFGGRTLLETPLRQWLQDTTIELPFCLCWANESWSRRWDGREKDVLIAQTHSPADDLAFIEYVSGYLRDERALRVDGKPMLLVYRPGLLPEPLATTARWRTWCRDNGLGEIHLAYVQSFERPDPGEIGFDSAVEFPPNMSPPSSICERQLLLNPDHRGDVLDWRYLADDARRRAMPDYRLFPGVNPGWDNEPRRPGRGHVYLHASPRRYGDWLRDTIRDRLADVPASQRFVFINAWNEWAEGAVLEPDARLGYAWLEATRQALWQAAAPAPVPQRPCAVVHAWYVDVLDELLERLRICGVDWRLVVTTAPERADAVRAALARAATDAELFVFENRGRDVLPFLHVANRLLDEGVDVVLKLHTKQSDHRWDGDRWRADLLDKLLSPDRVPAVLSAFEADPLLGMVAPEGHVQPLGYFWGGNEANVRRLATRIGLAGIDPDTDRFAAGSMFVVRLAALRPLLDAHLDPQLFESERGQVDGTCAHAVERLFGLSALAGGFRIATAAGVCGEPDPADGDAPYPYARRDG
ncbi:glycoside hydrolase family 99-like domain-containing protein [Luteimonas saliphila]|uniref:glycoside hydrolase family 99-like domain-containing protein n=1 Tax=Luteimonas saliphila TaxID=2804919 RepID=UPI00192D2255|nr:glycoside hydrolase family 99-like domain-containing protein [Luteimonas saliphila]